MQVCCLSVVVVDIISFKYNVLLRINTINVFMLQYVNLTFAPISGFDY